MKKSQLIILLTVVFILTVIVLILIQNYSLKNQDKAVFEKSIPLSDFSVIVGEPNSWFEIKSGNSNCIIIQSKQKLDIKKDFYKVKNDTLFLLIPQKRNFNVKHLVQCKGLVSLNLKNHTECYISNFKANSLNVKLNGGKLILSNFPFFITKEKEWVEINELNVKANKGHILLSNAKIASVDIQLNHASAAILSEVFINKFKLQLKDSSNFHSINSSKFGNICNTDIDADATSTFDVFKR